MKKTRRTTEQIIRILREAESNGMKSEQVCRLHNISAQTYYRWKKKYGGMGLKEARRLRELEQETTALKTLLAAQLLKARALEIALEKTSEPRGAAGASRAGARQAVVFGAIGLPVARFQSFDLALSTQATAIEETIN